MALVQYLWDGGIVMIPIGLCSIIALAAFLERMVMVRRGRLVPRALVTRVVAALEAGDTAAARDLCSANDVAVTRILGAAIAARGQPRDQIKERLEEVGRREAAVMERYIPVLGTIASVAPLLGLLGTVGGMISTFQVIESMGGVQSVGDLAGGIRQALVTTFAGLSVGIPALLANRYLLSRVDAVLLDLEECSLLVLELLVRRPERGDP